MRFESHFCGATALAIATPFLVKEAGLNLSFDELVQIIPAIILGGAVSCDLDTNSKASRYYAIASLILTGYWFWIGYYLHPLIVWIPFGLAKSGKHRGITHSWFLPIAIIFLPTIIDFLIFSLELEIRWLHSIIVEYRLAVISYAAGIYTHLFLDIKKIKGIVRFIGGKKMVKLLYG